MPKERIIPTPGPSDLPTFKIVINDKELPTDYHVTSIVVTKMVNKIARAKLIISDGEPSREDFPVSNLDYFTPGKNIEILAGYHSHETSIFTGMIIKHGIKTRKSGVSYLVVECQHPAAKLTIGKKSAYYQDVKDSDVIDEIISGYSIARTVESTSVTHKELIQYEATDWDFVISRAEANGMLVFTNDDKIEVAKPNMLSSPALSLLYGATILEMDAEMDARHQLAEVSTQAWDSANQSLVTAEAREPEMVSQGNVDAKQLADILKSEKYMTSHTGNVAQEELRSWADAQLLKSRMARIRGRVTFTGYANIHPGNIIELNGTGERFNGKAYVTGIRHEIGKGIWTTDAQMGLAPEWFVESNAINAKPAAGLVPAVSGLQVGVVTRIHDDPADEHRVMVRMPIIDPNAEGVWARVASPDAGTERGVFFRPELNDEVVMGFFNDDPRDPVVLGMLNSSAKPAPITASEENPEKGVVTHNKLKLIFNDEKKSVHIETPAGKTFTLSEDAGSIVMEDENKNAIEMNADGINIKSAGKIVIKADGDVQIEGMNTNVKAGSQFKAEGSSGAELSTAATAVVKGSLVQIN